MNSNSAAAVLNQIRSQVQGNAGNILSIHINNDGTAVVNLDWEAFKSNFQGASANRGGSKWSKSVGDITYLSRQDENEEISDTVPT